MFKKKNIWSIAGLTFVRSTVIISLSNPSSPPLSPSVSSGVWYIDLSADQSFPMGSPAAWKNSFLYKGEYSVSTSLPLLSVITQLKSTSTSSSSFFVPNPKKPVFSTTIAPQLHPTQKLVSFAPLSFSRLMR